MLPFAVEDANVSAVIAAYRSGTLTCRELTEVYLQRIKEHDPFLHSVICIHPDVLQEADRMDRYLKETGKLIGPLHGIPVMIKDNIGTADMPTTAGSLALQDFVPENDAFIVKKLRDAGALILGKTNMHEFAIWGETISSILGQTMNPYDYTRTPGGSSGGSGAAVAASFCLGALGTDTVNSVRSPAASCSLVGIRPTLGVVSRSGIIPYSLSQDTAGPIAGCVEDAALILGVIAGYDAEDNASVRDEVYHREDLFRKRTPDGLQGKRIGILESFFGKEEKNRKVNEIVRKAVCKLEEAGAELISLNEEINSTELARNASIHLEEFREDLDAYLAKYGKTAKYHSLLEIYESGLTHPGVWESIYKALFLTRYSDQYGMKLRRQGRMRGKILRLMDNYGLDVIVFPHQQQLVCEIGMSQKQRNGVLAAVTGFPSITVPAGYAESEHAPVGVPVGLEMLGRPYSENLLVDCAYAYEQINLVRRPPVLK